MESLSRPRRFITFSSADITQLYSSELEHSPGVGKRKRPEEQKTAACIFPQRKSSSRKCRGGSGVRIFIDPHAGCELAALAASSQVRQVVMWRKPGKFIKEDIGLFVACVGIFHVGFLFLEDRSESCFVIEFWLLLRFICNLQLSYFCIIKERIRLLQFYLMGCRY